MFNRFLMMIIVNGIFSANSFTMGIQQKPQGQPLTVKKALLNSSFKSGIDTHTYVHDFKDGGPFFTSKFPTDYLDKRNIRFDRFSSHTENYTLITGEKIDWLESNLALNIARLSRCLFDTPKEIKEEFSFLREDTEMLLAHINEYKIRLQDLIKICEKRYGSSSFSFDSLNNDLKRLNAIAELAKKFYESLY